MLNLIKKLVTNQRGLSLLENIISLSIIGAAAGMLITSQADALSESSYAQAVGQVATYNIAAARYKNDTGLYPSELADLTVVSGGKGPWLSAVKATDPWGTAYQYSAASGKVKSAGPDKVFGTADDIF